MSQELELKRAVREYQAGKDTDRNADLITKHLRPLLSGYFRKNIFSEKDHEDLTQETLMRVFNSLGTFRSEGYFKGWVFAIAGNLLKDALRGQKTEKRFGRLVSLDDNVSEENNSATIGNGLADNRANPEQDTLNNEALAIYTEAIKHLSPRESQVLKLKINDELSTEKIAKILSISEETVRVTLRNARKKVRAYLNDKLNK